MGIFIDCKMSWINHINHVKSKVAKGIGILCKARKYLKRSTLLTLYYSFIYPYITYCLEVWGNANNTYICSLFKLQKRIVRIIDSANFRAHSEPILSKLDILPITKLFQYCILVFMYKYNNNLLPYIFKEFFIKNYEIHDYPTRQHDKFHIPKAKTSFVKKTLRYVGVSLWNKIYNDIPSNCTITVYKLHIKNYLKNNII